MRSARDDGGRSRALPERALEFLVAALVLGVGGITTSVALWRRVWRAYAAAPATVRERLAYAILGTIGMRETLVLVLPILLLVLVVGVKIGLALR